MNRSERHVMQFLPIKKRKIICLETLRNDNKLDIIQEAYNNCESMLDTDIHTKVTQEDMGRAEAIEIINISQ
jgi:hypothetical protein